MGNIATIASCKCNKQQDHSEMDLNKDKQELLKNLENSKRENEKFNEEEYQNQNINIDNFKFGEVGTQNKHVVNENDVTPVENILKANEGRKTSKETLLNNNASAVPLAVSNNDIKEYSHNINNKNANNNNKDFAANNSEIENFSNNAKQQPKSFSHLKSNSNEIRMDIYEDESQQDLNNNPMLKNLQNQISNRKKFYNSNTNSSLGNQNANGIKQSPLEIINEINADVSKESFYEGNAVASKLNKNPEISEIKAFNNPNHADKSSNLNHQQDKNENLNVEGELKNNNFDIVNTNENAFDNTAANINNSEKNKFNNNNNSNIINSSGFNIMSNYNSENIESQNNPQIINYNNDQFNNTKEDIQKNYSSHQGYRSNQPMQTRVKKPQGSKEERWKNIKITNIVAERVLLSNQEDIICFQSDLRKLNNTSNMLVKDNLIYTTRFCVLNKVYFKIFKNRETFLRLQKAQIEIPINSIKDCNYVQINAQKTNKNSHFYLNYVSFLSESRMEESKKIFKNLTILDDGSVLVEKYNQKIKKLGFVGESNNVSKDHSTIKKSFENSHAFESQSNPLLIFASEDEDLINKWIAVLNYFMSK